MATGKIVRSVSISIQQTVSEANIIEKNAYRQKLYFLNKKIFLPLYTFSEVQSSSYNHEL